MKNKLRLLSYFLLSITLLAFLNQNSYPQLSQEECTAIYQRYYDNYKGPEVEKMLTAMAAGKEYLAKCPDHQNGEKLREFITNKASSMGETIERTQFDVLSRAHDYEKAIAVGKQVLARHPDDVDIMLALARAGYSAAFSDIDNNKFRDETIGFAKAALEKLDGPNGKTPSLFKTEACKDGRINAIGSMNLYIGNIMWFGLKDKKGAVPYLYRSTQQGCTSKANPDTYVMIGAMYQEEYNRLTAELHTKLQAAGGNETEETNKILALSMGYAERIMDANGRAYVLANSDSKFTAAQKDPMLKKARDFYEVRYDGKMEGFEAWLTAVNATPFPDPSTPVALVVVDDQKQP